jgi:hypothetical protein
MSARADAAKDHFDLLPFIAILMCMLGCLLLVTMSVAALSMGPGAGEGWIPTRDPSQTTKIPVLIEWDGTNLLVHRNGQQEQIKWTKPSTFEFQGMTLLRKDDKAEENPALDRLYSDLQTSNSTHYALFAVRPSGFDDFSLMVSTFRSRDIEVGFEPIGQSKPVRLLNDGRNH